MYLQKTQFFKQCIIKNSIFVENIHPCYISNYRYPQLSTDDLSRYINKLRERNSGKLSGMSVASIEQQVGALMVQFPPMNPPPQASASALADQDSNNCAVCLEEMFDHNSKRLNPCGHRFHHHCINVRV